MPKFNVSSTEEKKKKKKKKRRFIDTKGIKLPLIETEPEQRFDKYSVLIHGEKKIGKTDLSLQGGRTLLLQCDPPQLAYRRLEILCKDWTILRKSIKALAALDINKFPYDRVCIDGIGTAFDRCQTYICQKLGIEHPSDEDWGKGWNELTKEFTAMIDMFLSLSCGRWFLCHSEWKEKDTRRNIKITHLQPLMTTRCAAIVNGKVDQIMAYDYEGTRRVLIIRGDESIAAGGRIDQPNKGYPHFRTPSGKRIKWIYMDSSAEQGYKNILAAFDNKQEKVRPLR